MGDGFGDSGRRTASGRDRASALRRAGAVLAAGLVALSLVAAGVGTVGAASARSTAASSSTSTSTAAGSASEAPLPPVDGSVPTDPNGDGLYEDINANGRIDVGDAVTLFRHLRDPNVTDHVGAYDFTGNGAMNIGDAVAVFARTTPPTARFEAAPATASVGEPIAFDASASTGARNLTSYEWTFDDGTTASGVRTTRSFDEPGTYEVTLRVTDAMTAWNETTRTVTVRADGAGANRSDRRVTAYYTSWARYDRDYQPSDAPLENVTHLNYAFLDVTANGTVVLGDSWGDRQNLQAFRDRAANHPNTTFLLSIGGWSYSDDFSEAAATPERRERFARSAIALMRKYDFDGIDVDWEYPGGGGKAGNTVGANDPHNFTLLLETVREELDRAEREDGREYELTIAASADPTKVRRLEVGAIADDVDQVNVMTYDYGGAWADRTGHNAPLYAEGPGANGDPALSVNRSMRFWASQPIDRSKLSLGLPFYGRSYAGVTDPGDAHGLNRSFTGTPDGTYGSQGVYEYWDVRQNLTASGSTYEYHWDGDAKVPYLYSPQKDVLVSYDDRRSIRLKTGYAEREGFGGVMIWALSHDRNGVLIETVDEEVGASSNGSNAGA